MNRTFQSFVFGCRVNEAERIKIDRELVEAGFIVDLASPSFLIINTCAITGKAEREARQLINQLHKQHPQAQIVVTGCSATVWQRYNAHATGPVDWAINNKNVIFVPNDRKSSLVGLLADASSAKAEGATFKVAGSLATGDKFRYSNRLLVKIQDGCHRFCSYCIVPYLRGLPQSQTIDSIIAYIVSFSPPPSEVVLTAINTEAFGKDSKESFVSLIEQVLKQTPVPRLAFGSVHPWSLTDEFITYYRNTLSHENRFIHFFHVPIQSGSPAILKLMKREYQIDEVMKQLAQLRLINPYALIATDVIVGFLGETDELFEETYALLKKSPINRLHVFRFSNRPHTAAYYMKNNGKSRLNPDLPAGKAGFHRDDTKKADCHTSDSEVRNDIAIFEPTPEQKKNRANKLLELSKTKYQAFLEAQIGRESDALVIAPVNNGFKILLDNHMEGILKAKHCLPGQIRRVTIIAAKDGVAICKES